MPFLLALSRRSDPAPVSARPAVESYRGSFLVARLVVLAWSGLRLPVSARQGFDLDAWVAVSVILGVSATFLVGPSYRSTRARSPRRLAP
jgi:hypothetical protein